MPGQSWVARLFLFPLPGVVSAALPRDAAAAPRGSVFPAAAEHELPCPQGMWQKITELLAWGMLLVLGETPTCRRCSASRDDALSLLHLLSLPDGCSPGSCRSPGFYISRVCFATLLLLKKKKVIFRAWRLEQPGLSPGCATSQDQGPALVTP